MRFLRKNDGFTLVELIVTIAVGSIAAMAAATVLILGLRIYNNANETALKQNEVNIGITVIENLVAEKKVTVEGNVVKDADGNPLVEWEGTEIVVNDKASILKNVEDFKATLTGQVLSFEIKVAEVEEPYEFSVYCRLVEIPEATEESTPPAGHSVFSLSRTPDAETMLASAVEDDNLTPHVRTLLKTLASQQESTGRIQTGDGEGEYYSEWYIGGYGENSDWNSSTPWCACFVSWALEQCGGYLEGETPRYANVDTFCTELVTSGNWKADRPEAGDLIFFDWTADGDYDPAHIGVVIGANENRVYTIEGNVNGRVALCDYALDDDRILGYGELNWTK